MLAKGKDPRKTGPVRELGPTPDPCSSETEKHMGEEEGAARGLWKQEEPGGWPWVGHAQEGRGWESPTSPEVGGSGLLREGGHTQAHQGPLCHMRGPIQSQGSEAPHKGL